MLRSTLTLFLFSLLFLPVTPSFAQVPDDQMTTAAPDSFQVAFETTKGRFDVMVYRIMAPKAADRFYHLVRLKYFDDMVLYRVVPNFVVQWGIHNDPDVNLAWKDSNFTDEPVMMSNKRGTISFARGGKDTRTVQLFINLRDNLNLDTLAYGGARGYPPFAKIISGMDVVDQFYGGYGDTPTREQSAINAEGRAFLDRNYPDLDVIQRAYFVTDSE